MQNDYTTKEILEEAFVFLDIKLSDESKDFLYLQLFGATKNPNLIRISSIQDMFNKKYYEVLEEEKKRK